MAKDDVIEIEGIVTDALPNAMFKVDIGNGHTILAHISGKLRMNFIKILPGDKVTVQMSPCNFLCNALFHSTAGFDCRNLFTIAIDCFQS